MRSVRSLQIYLVLLVATLLLTTITSAALGLSAKAVLDAAEMAVGESVQLTITVEGAFSASQPKLNVPDGLSINFIGQSSENQWVNGKTSSLVSLQYLITGIKPGQYQLGPFQIAVNGKQLTTNNISLQVQRSGNSSQSSQANPGASSAESLFLEVQPSKNRAFLGERIPVKLRLYVKDIELNDLNYPVLNQPEFVISKMAKPVTQKTVRNGQTYQMVEFTTTVIPVKAGSFRLEPVTIDCEVIVPVRNRDPFVDGFFNDYQKQTIRVKSKAVAFTALDLPGSKPADFSGGIGQFQMNVVATPTQVSQGDPVTLKIAITGQGNFDSLGAPRLSDQTGLKVYDAQKKIKTTSGSNANQALFEQVVIPLDPKIKQISPFSLSFFNPETQKYQQITSPAIPITVKANPNFHADQLPGMTTSSTSSAVGSDLVYIKETFGELRKNNPPLARQTWFWLLQLLPLFGVVGAVGYRRHQQRLQANTPLARSIRANQKAVRQLQQVQQLIANQQYDLLLDNLSSILREFLGEKYQLPAAGITGTVGTELANQQISAETLRRIKEFFDQYDFFRFTGAKVQTEDARRLFETVQWIVKSLEDHYGLEQQTPTSLGRVV